MVRDAAKYSTTHRKAPTIESYSAKKVSPERSYLDSTHDPGGSVNEDVTLCQIPPCVPFIATTSSSTHFQPQWLSPEETWELFFSSQKIWYVFLTQGLDQVLFSGCGCSTFPFTNKSEQGNDYQRCPHRRGFRESLSAHLVKQQPLLHLINRVSCQSLDGDSFSPFCFSLAWETQKSPRYSHNIIKSLGLQLSCFYCPVDAGGEVLFICSQRASLILKLLFQLVIHTLSVFIFFL